MFRALAFLLWTGCAVALGVWLGSARVAGATPVQHLSRLADRTPLQAEAAKVKSGIEDKLEDARDALSSAHDHQVRERHSDKDKDAVDKLIAKRAPSKPSP
jgi:hypothetical protein